MKLKKSSRLVRTQTCAKKDLSVLFSWQGTRMVIKQNQERSFQDRWSPVNCLDRHQICGSKFRKHETRDKMLSSLDITKRIYWHQGRTEKRELSFTDRGPLGWRQWWRLEGRLGTDPQVPLWYHSFQNQHWTSFPRRKTSRCISTRRKRSTSCNPTRVQSSLHLARMSLLGGCHPTQSLSEVRTRMPSAEGFLVQTPLLLQQIVNAGFKSSGVEFHSSTSK